MVTPQNFIHRLKSQNHLNVSITDSGSKRVKEYGVKDVQILAEHFFQGEPEEKKNEKKEELLSEWQKLKYNFLQMREDIPPEIAKPTNNMMTKSPTEWLLERMLSMRSTYQHFFSGNAPHC